MSEWEVLSCPDSGAVEGENIGAISLVGGG